MRSSRRGFLSATLGAGLALTTRTAAPAPAPQPARRRLIVDSQIHLWKANTPDRPWVPGATPQLPEPFTIERLVPMMDEAGVDRVVIVPPTLEGTRLDYAQEAVKRYPGRFAIMGRIALDDPQPRFDFRVGRPQLGVVGIRLNIAGEQARWLTDGTADWFWPAAEKGRPSRHVSRLRSHVAVRDRLPSAIPAPDHHRSHGRDVGRNETKAAGAIGEPWRS